MFVLLSRDRCPNALPLQVLAIFTEGIAFIGCDPLRADAQMTIAAPECLRFPTLPGVVRSSLRWG